MQLTCQNIRIVEKVVETKDGVFLARFAIADAGGMIKWKLLDLTPFNKEFNETEPVILIAAPVIGAEYIVTKTRFEKIISPFTDLLFFVSQPTRAPGL